MKTISYKTNEVKRSYFLNLFSNNAEKRYDISNTKTTEFSWNIRDLQLGSVAEIALIQITHNNASDNTTYCIRALQTYADGYDSYNITSAVLYLGNGMISPANPTYHKLISNNLNQITLIITDDISSSATIYGGINNNISFGIVLEIIDYVDEQNTY